MPVSTKSQFLSPLVIPTTRHCKSESPVTIQLSGQHWEVASTLRRIQLCKVYTPVHLHPIQERLFFLGGRRFLRFGVFFVRFWTWCGLITILNKILHDD